MEPHGYRHDLGRVEAIRHPNLAIEDGYVLVGQDGRAVRCYGLGADLVQLPGYVSRWDAEVWLFEREVFYGRHGED